MVQAEYITLQSVKGDVALNSAGTSLVLETNARGIADRLKQAIRLHEGASLYDLRAGFPWGKLLGSRNPTAYNTRVRAFLNKQPFVQGVDSLDISLDPNRRTASIAFTITTTLGESVSVSFDTLTEG